MVADPVLRPLTGVWGLYYFVFLLFWGQYALYATRDLGLTPVLFGVVGRSSPSPGCWARSPRPR